MSHSVDRETPLPMLRWHNAKLYQRWQIISYWGNGDQTETLEWREIEEGPIDD